MHWVSTNAHLIRYPLKQVHHFQRIQIFMHRLVYIHSDLLLRLDGRREALFPALELVCGLLCAELVVNDFERADLLDGAVRRRAVRAVDDLACESVDGLANGRALDIFKGGPPKAFEVDAPVRFGEEDAGTGL